jgi:polyhydroxybutyrate depolymerase
MPQFVSRRSVIRCVPRAWLALAPVTSLGCASERGAETQTPDVAARHAPTATLIAPDARATPAAGTASAGAPGVGSGDPALAFNPPARLRLPSTLQAGERVPLLLVLHGFGVSPTLLIAKASLNQLADQKKFAYLAPEGVHDGLGRPFWNAGKSCCDLDHRGVDDVKRLRELLDANLADASLDPKRVFVIGYSNGGFMAQRLACDVGDRIAGVISIAGAAPAADVACTQSTALSILEIHGDADPVVHYAGGTVFDRTDVTAHSSAPDTARYWAEHLSCSGQLHDVNALDLEPHLEGRETAVQRYDDCQGAVELWTVKGGGHYVALQPPALDAIWGFVQAHPKTGT